MTPRLEAELALGEYMLGLDALGLGAKAEAIWQRAWAREIRPAMLRQRHLLDASLKSRTNKDAQVLELEEAVAAGYRRCLDSLKTLWLTEGITTTQETTP